MKLVVLESPYAGDIARNLAYARAAVRDCLRRGEAPLASHLLYTQVLDDWAASERALGMEAGFAWGALSSTVVVYDDLGISNGMREGIERAKKRGAEIIVRRLGNPWSEETARTGASRESEAQEGAGE